METITHLKYAMLQVILLFKRSYSMYNNKTPILLPKSFPLKSFKYFKILDTQILKDHLYFVKVLKTCDTFLMLGQTFCYPNVSFTGSGAYKFIESMSSKKTFTCQGTPFPGICKPNITTRVFRFGKYIFSTIQSTT